MASVTGSLLSLGSSIYSMTQAEKQKREAKNALNNYERQDLENAFEDIPISTVGSELLREEGQRTTAAAVDAARSGGVRGIVGAVPQIVAANNDLNRDAQKYLDDQIMKRNWAIANDKANIRGIQEEREYQDLAGIGNLMNVGNQNSFNAQRGITANLSNIANLYQPNPTPRVSSTNATSVGPIMDGMPVINPINQPPVNTVSFANSPSMYNPFPNPTPYSPNTFNPMNFGGF